MINIDQKMIVACAASIIFVLLNAPTTYKITNSITKKIGFSIYTNNGPNLWGVFIHGIIFFLLMLCILYL
jgi:hypothetical protein